MNPQSINKLIRIVSDYNGIDFTDIGNKTRKRSYVHARQMFCYIMKKQTKLSLTDIGSYVNKPDHVSVLHSIRVIQNYIDLDRGPDNDIDYRTVIAKMLSEIIQFDNLLTERSNRPQHSIRTVLGLHKSRPRYHLHSTLIA